MTNDELALRLVKVMFPAWGKKSNIDPMSAEDLIAAGKHAPGT